MSQDIIVIAIIALTVGYVIFSFAKSLTRSKNSSGCGGCTGCEISKNRLTCSSDLKKF